MIIAAGGSGKRLGGKTPKQFLRLGGKTVLEHSLSAFQELPPVKEIVIVAPSAHVQKATRVCKAGRFVKVTSVVTGGKERQHSVWNGLMAFRKVPDIVLVHDAARPFIRRRIIKKVIDAVCEYGTGVVGVPVKDTIKVEGMKGFYETTLERNRLWAVQTPQGFLFDLIVKAHTKARKQRFLGTDEASLVERLGVPVRIVHGDYRNIKITTADDLKKANSGEK